MVRNRRRGHYETIRVLRYGRGIRGWLKSFWHRWNLGLLLFLSGLFALGILTGWVWRTPPAPQGPPLPPDAEHITLHQDPHVVSSFKAWTESPQGSCLIMVWSDGQVWRAYTDNPKSIRSWDLLAHVRTGGE